MILYFSGTGNSHYVAKLIADSIGDGIQSLNERMREQKKDTIKSERPYVIVTPTYAWRIPKAVESLLMDLDLEGERKTYFVMTCGEDIGNAAKFLRRLCKRKGLAYMGVAAVSMPENYIAMYEVPDKDTAAAIIVKAEPKILALAKRIQAGEPFEKGHTGFLDHIKSSLINPLFQRFWVSDKKFYAESGCSGCGVCARLCPKKNIKLKEGRPVWNRSCIHCMACINGCPKQVIQYGTHSKGKSRYYLKIR